MSPRPRARGLTDAETRHLHRLTSTIGTDLRGERIRRRLTMEDVAAHAGLSRAAIHAAESGRTAMLETYLRIATSLGRRLEFGLAGERGIVRAAGADTVHAAMGEAEAGHLQRYGFQVRLDEPYQHYQFAGRGDVLAWDPEVRALLHIENRTRFPNLQESFGAFSAKRSYLPRIFADRIGLRGGWRSVTNVMLGLWSSEVLHVVRLRSASFLAACPDDLEPFLEWWAGRPPSTGESSTFGLFDPGVGLSKRRSFADLATAIARAVPRYRGYGDAAARLGQRSIE